MIQPYECIKTGALIRLGGVRYAYGDLFRYHEGHIMNVTEWADDKSSFPGWKVHAEFQTWYQWFGEYEGEGTSVVVLGELVWFNYEGVLFVSK